MSLVSENDIGAIVEHKPFLLIAKSLEFPDTSSGECFIHSTHSNNFWIRTIMKNCFLEELSRKISVMLKNSAY